MSFLLGGGLCLGLTALAGAQSQPFDRSTAENDRHGALREPQNAGEAAALAFEVARPAPVDGTPSAMGHYGLARQASTWLSGPRSNDVEVQVLDLEDALGKDVGTSPWHIVSTRRYQDEEAVTLWGTSLTDTYRIVVDGDRFEGLDRFVVNRIPSSVPWNLVGLDNGRVLIPDQDGFGQRLLRKTTRDPSLLVLTDDPAGDGRLDQGIVLESLLEMDTASIAKWCGRDERHMRKRYSFTAFDPTFTGEWVTAAIFEDGESLVTYLVILDASFRPIAAQFLDDSIATNLRVVERVDRDRSAIYLASEDALIKAVWTSSEARLDRIWERPVGIRGRTGTTPTLLNTKSGEAFIVLIEAKAAVLSLVNGLIVSSSDRRPSALVAVRREDQLPPDTPEVIEVELPDWLTTVENSPAVFGDTVVVANYSGYLPNGLLVPPGGAVPDGEPASWLVSRDAVADFATGIVALRYDADRKTFVKIWEDAEVQFSGVPAISGGANRVYGTGAEEASGKTYAYAYRLHQDDAGPAGQQVMRVELGIAPFRTPRRDLRRNLIFDRRDYQLRRGEFYDQGNNLILLEDGSLIVTGGRSLARVRDRK